ncbi:hypothetical protein [Streptomyces sp. SAI-090]|uniref:hypothetical protein n=1 Tax=Streptomyces sp. SAI-090 TaxID=2940545 RepID=UPI0024769932|nr:hypothetical protein [Streptomyces sp. SAI-090]MDH6522038.1 membrane-associated PAP2 superfamily phosphatase [Streptomyces sp. SAI-090]
MTLVEQEEHAQREAEPQGEDEGGHCFGVEISRPVAEARDESAPAGQASAGFGRTASVFARHPRPRQGSPLTTP